MTGYYIICVSGTNVTYRKKLINIANFRKHISDNLITHINRIVKI